MYQPETAKFLGLFARDDTGKTADEQLPELMGELKKIFQIQTKKFNTAERTAQEKKYGLLHPVVIAEAMLKKFGFSAEDNAKLADIIAKAYPIDPTTEFYTKQSMPSIIGLAHLYAKETKDMPVCMVEGDFTNMAGCNKHFGKEFTDGKAVTDKLIHEVCAIVENAFKGRAKEVHCIRAGGDETRLIVYGLQEQEVDKILKEHVQPQINLLAAKFGVHNIEHTKKQKLPGFGASFACVDLNQLRDPSIIKEKMDATIGARKIADARMRYGMVGNAGVDRYVDNYYKQELLDDGMTPADAAARVKEYLPTLQRLAKAAKAQWEELAGQGGEYHTLAAHYKAKDPHDFFSKHEIANRTQRSNEFARIHIAPLPDARHAIPLWDTEVSEKPVEDPELLRLRKALKAFGFTQAAEADSSQLVWNRELHRHEFVPALQEEDPHRQRLQRMIVDLMDMFHAPDPSTRCKSTSLMIQDADDYIRKHQGMRVMHIEVTNLTGLNNLNSNFADALLREVGKQIKKTLVKYPHYEDRALASHMADHVYYEGNGKFKVLLPPDYAHITEVEKALQKTIKTEILQKSVMGFAEDTYAHPPEPPAKPKNLSDSVAAARYAKEKAAYDVHIEQSTLMLEALQRRLDELRLNSATHITDIASIPHTRKEHAIPVGIVCYNVGQIDARTPAAEGLRRIDFDAAEALANRNTRQR